MGMTHFFSRPAKVIAVRRRKDRSRDNEHTISVTLAITGHGLCTLDHDTRVQDLKPGDHVEALIGGVRGVLGVAGILPPKVDLPPEEDQSPEESPESPPPEEAPESPAPAVES